MKLSPLKLAFAASLLVHGTIFAAYTVWHGEASSGRFAPSETRMMEIVIEPEQTSSVSESEPAPEVVEPTPAMEPGETIPVPVEVPPPITEIPDLIPVEEPVSSATAQPSVQPETPALNQSVSSSGAPRNSPCAFVSGQAGYLLCPKPAYPREARRQRHEGLVVLVVSISAEGVPEEVSIKESSGVDLLDNAAVEAVKRWQFTPALEKSRAASSQVEIPIRFRLSN